MTPAPCISLGAFPTPLMRCPDLGAELDAENLWIKRDDLTGFSWGGNKVRTIEFLLGDVMRHTADIVVVCGGPTSNFAALMAVACARQGLDVHQVSYGTRPGREPAALAAALAAGATVGFTGSTDRTTMESVAQDLMEQLRAQGRRPYFVPRGGATAVGALGYAHAAGEITRQLREAGMDAVTVVIPVGSGGTIAGLVAGLTFDFESDDTAHSLDVEVIGVSVSRPPDELQNAIETTAAACAAGRAISTSVRCRWRLVDGRGAGFGIVDRREAAVIDDMMRHTGFLIDTTYNGKALLWLRDTAARPAGPVVYWHTGGALAVVDRLGRGAEQDLAHHI